MRFGGRLEPLDGVLPRATYRWDAETDILSGAIAVPHDTRGFTGSIELEDSRGAVVTLDMQLGVLAAVEVVVWPDRNVVPGLVAPQPRRSARLGVPARPSQPGIGVLEVDVRMGVDASEDEAVIHLTLSGAGPHEVVALAENLLIELDGDEDLVGFWFLDVPPFSSDG